MFNDFLQVELPEAQAERANYVIAHCDFGYLPSRNLPLEVMTDDDVMLAYKYDGKISCTNPS